MEKGPSDVIVCRLRQSEACELVIATYFHPLHGLLWGRIETSSRFKSALSSSSYSAGTQMKSFPIATKDHDGGSSEETNKSKRRSVFIEGNPDAFSLYSNNEVRMDRLLYRQANATQIPIPSSNIVESDSKMETSTMKKLMLQASLLVDLLDA